MADTSTWTQPGDIADRWQPLTPDQTERAPGIIAMIERALRRRWKDLADRWTAAGETGDFQATVKDVVALLARQVLEVPADVPLRAKNWQETSGSESLSVGLDGTMAGWFLVLDPWMVDALDTEQDDVDQAAAGTPVFAAPDPGDWWDRTFPTAPEGRY